MPIVKGIVIVGFVQYGAKGCDGRYYIDLMDKELVILYLLIHFSRLD